jgi:hypothetical protein
VLVLLISWIGAFVEEENQTIHEITRINTKQTGEDARAPSTLQLTQFLENL